MKGLFASCKLKTYKMILILRAKLIQLYLKTIIPFSGNLNAMNHTSGHQFPTPESSNNMENFSRRGNYSDGRSGH